jgi:hypothetical protein
MTGLPTPTEEYQPADSILAAIAELDRQNVLADILPPAPTAKTKPAKTASPADETEEAPADEPAESSTDEDEAADPTEETAEEEEETPTDPSALIKDPERFLQAHEDIKTKAKERLAEITTLKSTVAELEAKLAEAPAESEGIMLQPTARRPLSSVNTERQLEQAEAFWKQELDWCRNNLDGGERPAGKNEEPDEWNAEQVKAHMDMALSVLSKGLSERRDHVRQLRESGARAKEAFPFFDEKHPLHKEADALVSEVMATVPEFSQHPRWPELAGMMAAGMFALSGKRGVVGDGKKLTIAELTGKTPDKTAVPAAKAKVVALPAKGVTAPAAAKAAKADPLDAQIAAAIARGDWEEASDLQTMRDLRAAGKAAA